jgi:hypothetical protein
MILPLFRTLQLSVTPYPVFIGNKHKINIVKKSYFLKDNYMISCINMVIYQLIDVCIRVRQCINVVETIRICRRLSFLNKISKEQHVLSVMQKAFDKGQQGNMDADKMLNWLKQELQTEYTLQSTKAL